MPRDDWYKKDVVLRWEGMSLSLAVAQELFSSHAVDIGSRLLLKSLDPDQFPERGDALDFGCGYGVLGLAWKVRQPKWVVRLVDRDALAVAFSAWNAERLDLAAQGGVSWSVGLGPGGPPPDGYALVLWNVPGKAGEAVLARLAGEVADTLGDNGLVALVIVNPLAPALRAVYTARPDLTITRDERFADHTIVHIKRSVSRVLDQDRPGPFDRGVFDREPHAFETAVGSYMLTPVVGLPEYESLGFDTVLMLSALAALRDRPDAVLIAGCGQGHLPVASHLAHGVASFHLVDRDLLALQMSVRALAAVGVGEASVRAVAAPDIGTLASNEPRVDTAIIRLEDQLPPPVINTMIQDLEQLGADDGLTVIVGGGSTSVSRWLALVSPRRAWNAQSRLKKRGSSAATLRVRGRRADHNVIDSP